jgi:hypothetical protein
MKSSRFASAIAFSFALLSFAALAQAQGDDRANELTLAGLQPGRDTLAAASKRYGTKYATEGNASGKQWRDTCTGRLLEIEADASAPIQSVTVSALGPMDGKCEGRRFDALDMKGWITGRGLRLGDPQQRIVEIYGEPSSTGPSIKGDRELEFLYYAFDWAGSDVPQVLQVYCARDTGRVVEMTLAYPSL